MSWIRIAMAIGSAGVGIAACCTDPPDPPVEYPKPTSRACEPPLPAEQLPIVLTSHRGCGAPDDCRGSAPHCADSRPLTTSSPSPRCEYIPNAQQKECVYDPAPGCACVEHSTRVILETGAAEVCIWDETISPAKTRWAPLSTCTPGAYYPCAGTTKFALCSPIAGGTALGPCSTPSPARIQYCWDADGDTRCDMNHCDLCPPPGTAGAPADPHWKSQCNVADCNDQDPNATSTGAAETCDGLDNNCDGQVDEGVRNCFDWQAATGTLCQLHERLEPPSSKDAETNDGQTLRDWSVKHGPRDSVVVLTFVFSHEGRCNTDDVPLVKLTCAPACRVVGSSLPQSEIAITGAKMSTKLDVYADEGTKLALVKTAGWTVAGEPVKSCVRSFVISMDNYGTLATCK